MRFSKRMVLRNCRLWLRQPGIMALDRGEIHVRASHVVDQVGEEILRNDGHDFHDLAVAEMAWRIAAMSSAETLPRASATLRAKAVAAAA
jgi:hypothetical protein